MPNVARQILLRFADTRADELRAVLWSFTYFFCLLCGYYVLRPVRDEMGIQAGVGNLPWLFTATFIAMLAVVPVFGWVSSRFPRRRFLPYVYLFFVANLLVFFVLFREKIALETTTKAFFVWVAYSISSWCRCSGASWPICTIPPKRGVCTASSPRAAAQGRSAVRP